MLMAAGASDGSPAWGGSATHQAMARDERWSRKRVMQQRDCPARTAGTPRTARAICTYDRANGRGRRLSNTATASSSCGRTATRRGPGQKRSVISGWR